MKIYLIRHLKTKGNIEHRYIGRTDEPLIKSEEQQIVIDKMKKKLEAYQSPDFVVSSPLKRCMETAKIYFPNQGIQIQQKLRESDFGLFENKTYEELKDVPEYRKWMQSNGTLPFPNGESHEAFLNRCRKGFEESVSQALKQKKKSICFVIHGGSIMAVLSQLSEQPSTFYDWMLKNGEGYQGNLDEKDWLSGKKALKEIRKL